MILLLEPVFLCRKPKVSCRLVLLQVVPPKEMFVTTMLATVVFTVFFQVRAGTSGPARTYIVIVIALVILVDIAMVIVIALVMYGFIINDIVIVKAAIKHPSIFTIVRSLSRKTNHIQHITIKYYSKYSP